MLLSLTKDKILKHAIRDRYLRKHRKKSHLKLYKTVHSTAMSERKAKHKDRALANAPKALSHLVDDLTKAAKLKSPFVSNWFKAYCLEVINDAMRKEGKDAIQSFEQWKSQQSIDHLHEGVQWFLFLLRDTDRLSMVHQEIIGDIRIRLLREEEESDLSKAAKTIIDCIRSKAFQQYGEPIEGLSAIKRYGKSTGINKQKGQKQGQDWVDGIPKALRNPVSRN